VTNLNEKIKISSQRILSKSGLLRTSTTLTFSIGFYHGIGGWPANFWDTKQESQDENKEFGHPRPRGPEMRKLMYDRTFFSFTALNKSLSYRFLFFLDNKQERISKVHVCQKKANKSQNFKNIYVTNTRNSESIGGTLFQKLKKMLLIGGITIICLVVTQNWNYIGGHCVVVNEDVHEKIKKDEQFCLKEYQKDLRTVS